MGESRSFKTIAEYFIQNKYIKIASTNNGFPHIILSAYAGEKEKGCSRGKEGLRLLKSPPGSQAVLRRMGWLDSGRGQGGLQAQGRQGGQGDQRGQGGLRYQKRQETAGIK